MRFGLQCEIPLSMGAIANGGFSYAEIPYTRIENNKTNQIQISGFSYDLNLLNCDILYEILEACRNYHANYIVLSTMNCKAGVFEEIVEQCTMMISDYDIPIFLENGCIGDDLSGYLHGPYSDVGDLLETVSYCNRLCEKQLVGICYNIGYANLITKNIRSQLHQCGEHLRMVHINDNDGRRNDKQMPYTFTKGRGDLSTDWPHIIGELFRLKFDKWVIFDTNGLFNRCPKGLQTQFVRLLRAVANEWEGQEIFVERVLNQQNKKLILFGAGKMLTDYMFLFGEKYPPYFAVDNGRNTWGTQVCGVSVKSPDEILTVPPEERNVVICCMHYDPIGKQLRSMGVAYEEFRDMYFV